jgi:RNase adaptor protein for sRNA GlmZ degradation
VWRGCRSRDTCNFGGGVGVFQESLRVPVAQLLIDCRILPTIYYLSPIKRVEGVDAKLISHSAEECVLRKVVIIVQHRTSFNLEQNRYKARIFCRT